MSSWASGSGLCGLDTSLLGLIKRFLNLNYHIHGYAGALQSDTLLQQTVTLSFDGVDHCARVLFHPSFL